MGFLGLSYCSPANLLNMWWAKRHYIVEFLQGNYSQRTPQYGNLNHEGKHVRTRTLGAETLWALACGAFQLGKAT